jgi:hypothetical protein
MGVGYRYLVVGQDNKIIRKAVKKTQCLPVPYEVARHLEFCNKLNRLKPEPHTRGL